jgi:type I restriction enzyme S subunit
VAATFRYRKKEELELLATVDFAALELIAAKLPANRDTIRKIIEDHPDWAPKLNRAIFSDANIANALAELARLFPATIGA